MARGRWKDRVLRGMKRRRHYIKWRWGGAGGERYDKEMKELEKKEENGGCGRRKLKEEEEETEREMFCCLHQQMLRGPAAHTAKLSQSTAR